MPRSWLTGDVLHARGQRGHAARRCAALTGRAGSPTRGACRSPARRRSPGVPPTAAPPCCTGAPEPPESLAPRQCQARQPTAPPRRSSHAGTIWAGHGDPGQRRHARCTRGPRSTRVDPGLPGRGRRARSSSPTARCWAAWTAGRLDDHDPLPWPAPCSTPASRSVSRPRSAACRALARSTTHRYGVLGGAASARRRRTVRRACGPGRARRGGARAWRPAGLSTRSRRCATRRSPVELSLTGGKDSRLVAAALVKAGVPVRGADARVRRPPGRGGGRRDRAAARHRARRADARRARAAGRRARPDPRHRAGRRRDAVRVRERRPPGPAAFARAVTAGGHGGELLRGGYAETGRVAHGGRARPPPAGRRRRAAAPPHHPPPGPAPARRRAGYVASLAPWTARARPRPAARARRLLPGEPGRPLVGRRPAGVPAAGAPGPAAVRRPRGARRPRRPARDPDQRRAVPPPSSPNCARALADDPAGRQGARGLGPGLPSTGAASTAARSRRSCATTSLDLGAPAASSRREPRRGREGAHPAARRTAPRSGPSPPSPACSPATTATPATPPSSSPSPNPPPASCCYQRFSIAPVYADLQRCGRAPLSTGARPPCQPR